MVFRADPHSIGVTVRRNISPDELQGRHTGVHKLNGGDVPQAGVAQPQLATHPDRHDRDVRVWAVSRAHPQVARRPGPAWSARRPASCTQRRFACGHGVVTATSNLRIAQTID